MNEIKPTLPVKLDLQRKWHSFEWACFTKYGNTYNSIL